MIENNTKYLDQDGLIKVFELIAGKYATYEFASNEEIYKSIENIKENLIPQVFLSSNHK